MDGARRRSRRYFCPSLWVLSNASRTAALSFLLPPSFGPLSISPSSFCFCCAAFCLCCFRATSSRYCCLNCVAMRSSASPSASSSAAFAGWSYTSTTMCQSRPQKGFRGHVRLFSCSSSSTSLSLATSSLPLRLRLPPRQGFPSGPSRTFFGRSSLLPFSGIRCCGISTS